jgi:hypothetical protein
VLRRRQYYHAISAVSFIHTLEECGIYFEAYLAFRKDSADTVEEVKGRDDVALYQHAAEDSRGGPPACQWWHFPEPLLEREAVHGACS